MGGEDLGSKVARNFDPGTSECCACVGRSCGRLRLCAWGSQAKCYRIGGRRFMVGQIGLANLVACPRAMSEVVGRRR